MLIVRCSFVVVTIPAMWQHCRRNDGRCGRSAVQLANFVWKRQEAVRFSVGVVYWRHVYYTKFLFIYIVFIIV